MRLPLLAALTALAIAPAASAADARPNVLWVTCEDISPNLGCYGDTYAATPNIDRLAAQGVRYTLAFAPIGVCAPSRSCLITGMYPPSIGTQHMRCDCPLPEGVKCFPQHLREAGYYCTNNVKTDYNFRHPRDTWDESSNQAHWRKRMPGQPFFSVFNFTTCHESQIRLPEAQYQKRVAEFAPNEVHDPAKAPVPPYHPDTPEVRRDWARYADMITYMDRQVGQVLKQLEEDGLAQDTIVFYFSDHGAGMPRSKRWLYDSSTRVPFVVRFPEKWKHLASGQPGTATDRLVSFVDFGPTVLSLAGVPVPKAMQGVPFLGAAAGPPREYVYGFRDRMDERYDLIRSVRDRRFKYIRNYRPDKPYFHEQHISYMYEMPTMKVWQTLADEGRLRGPASIFMARVKPVEELYDTQADPHEINNLAGRPEHAATLRRLRAEHRRWQREVIDLGLLPEADLRTRFGPGSPYDAVRHDPARYPIEHIAAAADAANNRPADVAKLIGLLKGDDPAVRFWGAVGLGALPESEPAAAEALNAALADAAPFVRVAAADAQCRLGRTADGLPVLHRAMADGNEWVRLQAANALDQCGDRSAATLAALRGAREDKNQYVVRVVGHALRDAD
jgi:uncharacterized sulfatase